MIKPGAAPKLTLEHLAALAKLLLYAGALVGAGAALAGASLRDGLGEVQENAPRRIVAGALTAVAAALAGGVLLVMRLGGELDGPILSAVFGGPTGIALGAQVGAGRSCSRRHGVGADGRFRLAGALLLLGSFGVTGHSAAASPWTGLLAAAHLVAAAWWLGGLLLLRQACRSLGAEELEALVRRFSRLALFVVGGLVASGAILVFVLVSPTWDAWNTPYARNLALKIALAVGALAIANVNRTRLVPRLSAGQPGAPRSLRRAVTLEIGLPRRRARRHRLADDLSLAARRALTVVRRKAAAAFLCLLFLLPLLALGQATAPRLIVEASPGWEPMAKRLRAVGPAELADAMRLLGLTEPGPPIRVIVAPEGSGPATLVEPWITAYSLSAQGLVVVIPERVGADTGSSLEYALRHEVAHVLISRAAGGRPLPRWIHEGLAMVLGGSWGGGGRSQLATLATMADRPVLLADLEKLFLGGPSEVNRAYAIATAFMRDLLDHHGPGGVPKTLAGVARGLSFEEAFREATGGALAQAESDFWSRQAFWYRWVPVFTSSITLWLLITLLALWALRRPVKDAARRRSWGEAEEPTLECRSGWCPGSLNPADSGWEPP